MAEEEEEEEEKEENRGEHRRNFDGEKVVWVTQRFGRRASTKSRGGLRVHSH